MYPERNLEALIYTQDQGVSARCAAVFADLPVDWTRLDDAHMAAELLSKSRYDFVLLDLDSASGTALLPQVRPDAGSRRHGVVLAITDGGIDTDILEMSYESLIFYPVRAEELENAVHRAMPLAERLAASKSLPALPQINSEAAVAEETAPAIERRLARPLRSWLRSFFADAARTKTQYSLSIVWQERIASGISAAGTIWYVHEITRDWSALAFLIPKQGPVELIGISVLLWLCAKHRRVVESSTNVAAEPATIQR